MTLVSRPGFGTLGWPRTASTRRRRNRRVIAPRAGRRVRFYMDGEPVARGVLRPDGVADVALYNVPELFEVYERYPGDEFGVVRALGWAWR